jgi:CheY-like chemotaxis protein
VLDRLFEPFFTTKPVGKGTGLGLAAVHGTMRRHHGAVTVRSVLGAGTRFDLWLPLAAGEAPASRPRTSAILTPATGCILVVDDEPMVRGLVVEHLAGLGYTVVGAADADEGVRRWREHRPDLVLLDMIMPGGGGPGAFTTIRSEDPHARVLLLSGFSQEGEAQRLLDAGALGFIDKPFTVTALAEAVQTALGRSRPQG